MLLEQLGPIHLPLNDRAAGPTRSGTPELPRTVESLYLRRDRVPPGELIRRFPNRLDADCVGRNPADPAA